jgi:hypothetical protein
LFKCIYVFAGAPSVPAKKAAKVIPVPAQKMKVMRKVELLEANPLKRVFCAGSELDKDPPIKGQGHNFWQFWRFNGHQHRLRRH